MHTGLFSLTAVMTILQNILQMQATPFCEFSILDFSFFVKRFLPIVIMIIRLIVLIVILQIVQAIYMGMSSQPLNRQPYLFREMPPVVKAEAMTANWDMPSGR